MLVFVVPGQLQGAGFAVFTQGAGALGEGLATAAHGGNPKVIFYNPALINRINGTQIENGVTFIAPMHAFHSNRVNTTAETEGEVFPPTLYLTHKHNEKVSLGVGIFSPLRTEYGVGSGLGRSLHHDQVGIAHAEFQSGGFFSTYPIHLIRRGPGFPAG